MVDECAKFSEYLGGYDKIADYSSSLAQNALGMLENAWKTQQLAIGPDLQAPFMKVIKLPLLKDYIIGTHPPDVLCSMLIRRIIDDFRVVACAVVIENELYVRISAFVYNSIEDYERLRDAILKLSAST